jgi:hypothetical protein
MPSGKTKTTLYIDEELLRAYRRRFSKPLNSMVAEMLRTMLTDKDGNVDYGEDKFYEWWARKEREKNGE